MKINTYEDALKSVKGLTDLYHLKQDVNDIKRLSEMVETMETTRKKVMEVNMETLMGWLKKVEIAKLEAQRPTNQTKEQYIEKLNSLEIKKFNVAKSIRDLEQTIEPLEAHNFKLKQRYSNFKKINSDLSKQKESNLSSQSESELILQMYRSFNIVITNIEDIGLEDRVLSLEKPVNLIVYSKTRPDLDTVDVDLKKNNMFFYTNYIWEKLEA